ncbi:MAG: GntR family transcriptional regulator / MocR family aminotransferase, partial [Nocardioidaceae bacterium]|nr:GntR family transcriptional regulator / MocR family aminotransferase [Nocardioidaceae bacterium]
MSAEWSGSSPELLVTLDRDRPLRAQLEAQLRTAIRSGRLAADERLPSTRTLARDLDLSRGLVQECYEQLRSEGYLTSRGGSATRVARLSGVRRSSPAAGPRAPSAPVPHV